MAFHITIIATGQIKSADDPIVQVLADHDQVLDGDVTGPMPFVALIGEIELANTAREFCDSVGVDPTTVAKRFIAPERAQAIADDILLRFELEGGGHDYVLDRIAAYAKAGASIAVAL